MIENITLVTGALYVVATFKRILWGFKTNINGKNKIIIICLETIKTNILL